MNACADCGYTYDALPRFALVPVLVLGAAQHAARLSAPAALLRARPRTGTWSPLEYACHVRDVLAVQRGRVLRTQAEHQPAFVPMDRDGRVVDDAYNEQDPAEVADGLRSTGAELARLLDGLDDAGWARTGVYNFPETAVRDVDWITRHTLHELTHHMMDVDRGLGRAP